MPTISSLSQEKSPDVLTIIAYGFDAAGFAIRDRSVRLSEKICVEFLGFRDPRSFDTADGVIIPQGIFEEFKKIEADHWFFGSKTQVWVHRSFLLERERQILNLLRAAKWVCFMVGEIVDNVQEGMHLEPVRDTDLCKRILNAFKVDRRRPFNLSDPPLLKSQTKEFDQYVSTYGSPRTVFELPHDYAIEREVLVQLGEAVVGFEFDHQLFFLPFRASRKDWNTMVSVVDAVVSAILRYQQNRVVATPAWVDELRFRSEEAIYLEINSLLERVNRLERQLASWRDFKAILTASGGRLTNRTVDILEGFFELQIDRVDQAKETLIVITDRNKPVAILETKDLENSSIEKLIDQVKARREGFSVPGLLIVNNNMSVTNILGRLQAGLANDVASPDYSWLGK